MHLFVIMSVMSVFESPLRCLLLLQELPTGLKVRVMSYNLLADELVSHSGWIPCIHINIISPAFDHWLHMQAPQGSTAPAGVQGTVSTRLGC